MQSKKKKKIANEYGTYQKSIAMRLLKPNIKLY